MKRRRQSACKPGSVGPEPKLGRGGHSSGTAVASRLEQPTRTTSLEAWPGASACRPYSVLLPVGFSMPSALLRPRCALTAPFHPYPDCPRTLRGGLLSVALSLGSPPPDVIRHRASMEPGLSSPDTKPGAAARPTDRPMCGESPSPVKPAMGADALPRP